MQEKNFETVFGMGVVELVGFGLLGIALQMGISPWLMAGGDVGRALFAWFVMLAFWALVVGWSVSLIAWFMRERSSATAPTTRTRKTR